MNDADRDTLGHALELFHDRADPTWTKEEALAVAGRMRPCRDKFERFIAAIAETRGIKEVRRPGPPPGLAAAILLHAHHALAQLFAQLLGGGTVVEVAELTPERAAELGIPPDVLARLRAELERAAGDESEAT